MAELIRGQIAVGLLVPGARLPSVRQLARDMSIAPGTVAKAFRRLVAEGFVVTRLGSGTRVAEHSGLLPSAVLAALRRSIEDADRHAVSIEQLHAALDAMWTAEHPTPPDRAATASWSG
ncbi:GntR family transcriptional regulator [Curtobacterium sp. RHCJP20]|uniref:GntR family transcriptional regulator n=1 Tax=Curtobacterium subtropicum TaxID=3055138 RepID=A0ABT7THV1_9MICO|nr:GntR family transcriptional regulator [Curtobacterium subtropicum]MDM7889163.1 GntR family transcriptional regulator [Curtobacterium subtropicum]